MGRDHAARRALATLGLLAAVAGLIPTETPAVGPGQWTPPQWWGGDSTNNRYAVHMMLMAGDGAPYHSRILWYGGLGGGENLRGGEWGWTPGSEGCSSYPDSNFTLLTPSDPGMDLFCGGHALLADGRAVLVGGTEHHSGSYGLRGTRLFAPGTGTSAGDWSNPHPGELAERRWYPTATTLRDGRVLALGGSQYLQHRVFGGRIEGAAPASPRADSVHRIVPIMGEPWDPSVLPSPDPNNGRPDARESHTGVDMTEVTGFGGQVFFGGLRGSDGRVLNDVWQLQRADSLYGTDYVYKWKLLEPALPSSPQPPIRRREHTAVKDGVGQMIVYGGRDSLGRPLDDVWRLYWNPDPTKLRLEWSPVAVSGAAPSGRYGHSAHFESRLLNVVDGQAPQAVSRMIVYGGADTSGASPVDRKVYELRFSSPSTATWYVMPETTLTDASTHPAPRKGHAAGWGDKQRYRANNSPAAHTAYIYGGELAGGVYSDSMWTLWTFRTGKYGWDLRLTSNTVDAPGPRARFSMVTDNLQGGHAGDRGPRLTLFGGENASGLADRFVYSIDPFTWGVPQPPAEWMKWEAGHVGAAGHVAVLETRDVHARVAEVFDPSAGASGSWASLPSALLQQPFYPLVFAVSGGATAGGRVVTASTANSVTHYLDLPGSGQTNGSWQPFTNGNVGFVPQSGVLYRPNRIMVAGGQSLASPYPVVGATMTLDATNLSGSWATSDSMAPRYYHNLVQLPDGKVLAVGGNGTTNRNNDAPLFRPQLWDPDGNGGAGTWTSMTGADTLRASTKRRGYHSTAILLPDGRVLVSGGEQTYDKYDADIFCPPYLFNADGSLATRPVIQASPRHVSFGQTFIVGVNQGANVASMCLVRPGATTHGFDENQRFVPLSYALTALNAPGATYYKVTVPADSSVVPPGDYLLFVLNAGGTPSIARWVRIGRTNGSTSQPATVTDLHRQCSDGTSVTLLWTPPGTDVGDPVPAPAQRYDIRYKTSAMNDWAEFQAGTGATNPPPPGDPTVSTEDHVTITGLTLNQTYWFRLAAKNHASGSGNWSALSNQVSFVIHDEECGGSGGGGGGGGGYEEGASLRPGVGPFSASFGRPGPGTPDSSYAENTLLPNVAVNVVRRDLLRLPHGPRWTSDGARVRLSRAGRRATHFERVRLLAVDHAAGEGVFVRGGELVSGATHDPVRVTHADGRDLTELFLAGGAFAGRDGDTLDLDLGADGPGSLVLSSSRAQLVRAPDRTGIDIAGMGAAGWAEVGHHDVRERPSDEVFDVPDLRRVRLVFRGVHDLEGVARFTPGSAVAVTAHSPSAAEHSRLGPVVGSFAAGDGTALSPGDQLLVDFAAEPPEEGSSRAWFLEVVGSHLEAAGGAQGARLAGEADVRPAAFALAAVRPNPSAGRTTIEFDVPRRADVRVEIFDVLGRRVATLADGAFPAGRHAIAWDGATASGARARAGVYLCRMTAGEFRARRTLVLRP